MSEGKVKKPSKSVTKKAVTSTAVKAKAAPQASKPGKVAAPKAASPARAMPAHDQIAALAHKFYVERGCKHGFHEQDWHRAVRELKGM